MAAKITKLATSRLTSSIASRRTKNRRCTLSAGPTQLVRPRGEHVSERGVGPGEVGACYQDDQRLKHRDPGQVGRDHLFDVCHLLCSRVRVGGAARLVEEGERFRIVGRLRVGSLDAVAVK